MSSVAGLFWHQHVEPLGFTLIIIVVFFFFFATGGMV